MSLGACVEHGDFGRVKRSTWNDIVAGTGAVIARERGEAVSAFPFTDDEELLRDRAWRFLTPAHERAYFQSVLSELVATRVLPARWGAEDRDGYHDALVSDGSVSPASRYRRLAEDAAADQRLLDPFARVASRVLAADRVRLAALGHARHVVPADVENAEARVVENRCLVAWVRAGVARRAGSYAEALEHLVIETPQVQAVPAERTLGGFAAARGMLDGLSVGPVAEACYWDRRGDRPGPPPPEPDERSRVPLVRKG